MLPVVSPVAVNLSDSGETCTHWALHIRYAVYIKIVKIKWRLKSTGNVKKDYYTEKKVSRPERKHNESSIMIMHTLSLILLRSTFLDTFAHWNGHTRPIDTQSHKRTAYTKQLLPSMCIKGTRNKTTKMTNHRAAFVWLIVNGLHLWSLFSPQRCFWMPYNVTSHILYSYTDRDNLGTSA